MTMKNFAVFDSDSHVVEPPELWEKYLDPEYRTLGKQALWRQEGRTASYLKVNGEIFRDRGNSNLPRHALWRPPAQRRAYRKMPATMTSTPRATPEAWNRPNSGRSPP